jgi:hypothetical protein
VRREQRLLTDRRVTGLHFTTGPDVGIGIEVTHNGRVFKRIGFETSKLAYRWACEQVYGSAPVAAQEVAV